MNDDFGQLDIMIEHKNYEFECDEYEVYHTTSKNECSGYVLTKDGLIEFSNLAYDKSTNNDSEFKINCTNIYNEFLEKLGDPTSTIYICKKMKKCIE